MIYIASIVLGLFGAIAAYLRAPRYGALRAAILVPVSILTVSGLFAMWTRLNAQQDDWSGLVEGMSLSFGLLGAAASFAFGILAAGLRLRYQRRP